MTFYQFPEFVSYSHFSSWKLLMSGEGKRSAKADDSVLLSQIEAVDVEAGQQFLEYLVLHKHSKVLYSPYLSSVFQHKVGLGSWSAFSTSSAIS